MIEKLDFIFSKGKLSLEYDGAEPKINTEQYIRIEDGRHPLMAPSECVPLQFEIGKSFDGVVITGPNTTEQVLKGERRLLLCRTKYGAK